MRFTIDTNDQGSLQTSLPGGAAVSLDGGSPTHAHPMTANALREATVQSGGGAPSHSQLRRESRPHDPAGAIDAGGPPSHLLKSAPQSDLPKPGLEGEASPRTKPAKQRKRK